MVLQVFGLLNQCIHGRLYQTFQVCMALQVFGLLDMHEQLDAQLPVLSQVLANTNSGNVFKVHLPPM